MAMATKMRLAAIPTRFQPIRSINPRRSVVSSRSIRPPAVARTTPGPNEPIGRLWLPKHSPSDSYLETHFAGMIRTFFGKVEFDPLFRNATPGVMASDI
jgi:hypothetical protein